MISIRPITSRIASRVLGTTFMRSAERTVELAPATSYNVEPPIMLAGELDRIRAHHYDCAPALNFQRLTQRQLVQDATRIHLMRNVIIADGTLLAKDFFDRIAPDRKRFLVRGDAERIGEAALCSTYLVGKYFGHWLREGTALEALADDIGSPALVLDRTPWLHESSYRELLELRPRRTLLARCDRLWVAEDRRFNSYFVERYERLRKRLRSRINVSRNGPARIFISRGNLGQGRQLVNEDEVRHALSIQGFVSLDPERMQAAEIARVFANARLVVSPEGSALAHAAIAMPIGGTLITIVGAQHFNIPYKDVADTLGFRFGLTIADPLDADRFSQPIDRLLRTIDLADAVVDGRSHAITRGPPQ